MSYIIIFAGERIENKQVLVNKSMPVVTATGLQPGKFAITIDTFGVLIRSTSRVYDSVYKSVSYDLRVGSH